VKRLSLLLVLVACGGKLFGSDAPRQDAGSSDSNDPLGGGGNLVFNRFTGSGYAVGWTATEVELSGAGTNAPKANLSPFNKKTSPAPVQPQK